MSLMSYVFRANTLEDGVSPVVGVILMVAVSVILSAVIGAFVFDLGNNVSANPQAGVTFSEDPETRDVTVTAYSIDNADELKILVDGVEEAKLTSVGESKTVSAGEVSVIGVLDGKESIIQTYSADFPAISFDTSPYYDTEANGWNGEVDAGADITDGTLNTPQYGVYKASDVVLEDGASITTAKFDGITMDTGAYLTVSVVKYNESKDVWEEQSLSQLDSSEISSGSATVDMTVTEFGGDPTNLEQGTYRIQLVSFDGATSIDSMVITDE